MIQPQSRYKIMRKTRFFFHLKCKSILDSVNTYITKLGTKSKVQPIAFSIHLKFDYTLLEVKINCVKVNTVQTFVC